MPRGGDAPGMRRSRATRVALAPAALAALLTLSGCVSVVVGRPSALDPPIRPAGGEVVIVGAVPGGVDDLARDALADLETFWAGRFPEVFGQPFQPLQGGYFSVDPRDADRSSYPQGVGCGADPLEAENNAYYCQSNQAPNSDAITYDRAFLTELSEDYGRFIPALVMAHEFGHAVQGRVGYPPASIATETQADCLAGAWTAWVAAGDAEHTSIRAPELDDLLRGYLLLRDPVGTGTTAETAHGSYFDRVSGFQEGFDSGPEACRDNFGPQRVYTQGEFSDEDLVTGGNASYDELVDIMDRSLLAVWDEAFREVFSERFSAPDIEPFRGRAPDCAGEDRDLVYCPEDQVVGYDEADLAPRAYDLGDFAVATAVAVPYGMAARDQLGLSTDDPAAVRSAVCLSGWYAARVYNRQAGSRVQLSPGDVDESVQFLLAYGNDPEVLPAAGLSGFQLVDLFRNGFVRGLPACDVGV